MIVTFDTSVLIDIERRDNDTIRKVKEIINRGHNSTFLTFIPYFELYFGILNKSPKNFNKSYAFLQEFSILFPSKRTAEILAKFRKKYEPKGKTLPLADYLIVSQVKEHGLILITKDKDFEMFEEIKTIYI